jgi:hypothetical protein
MRRRPVLLRRLLFASLLILITAFARAGGPKFVVGSSFFTAAAPGQPVNWAGVQQAITIGQSFTPLRVEWWIQLRLTRCSEFR